MKKNFKSIFCLQFLFFSTYLKLTEQETTVICNLPEPLSFALNLRVPALVAIILPENDINDDYDVHDDDSNDDSDDDNDGDNNKLDGVCVCAIMVPDNHSRAKSTYHKMSWTK